MIKELDISELSGFFIDEVDENIEQIENNVLQLEGDRQNKEFINNGINVNRLSLEEENLEEYFTNLIGEI